MKTKSSRGFSGFTLIELLVVISIIGILSAIVMAALSDARTRGKDGAVMQELSSMRSQAGLYYSDNGNSYRSSDDTVTETNGANANDVCNRTDASGHVFATGIFLDGADKHGLADLIAGVRSNYSTNVNSPRCRANATSWIVVAVLPSDEKNNADSSANWYCVDYLGNSMVLNNFINGGGLNNTHFDCNDYKN